MSHNMTETQIAAAKIVREGRKGNESKLGRGVWHFDQIAGPPGEVENGTCPGASEWCAGEEAACYAMHGNFVKYPTVRSRLNENTIAAKAGKLPSLDVIPRNGLLRLHVSGDFDRVPYVAGWKRAIAERPDISVWYYSRSHAARPMLAAAVQDLSTLNNVQGFASVDATMPIVPDWDRIAYGPDDDRFNPETTLDCPNLVSKGQITCKQCGFCFRSPVNDIVNVRWPYQH